MDKLPDEILLDQKRDDERLSILKSEDSLAAPKELEYRQTSDKIYLVDKIFDLSQDHLENLEPGGTGGSHTSNMKESEHRASNADFHRITKVLKQALEKGEGREDANNTNSVSGSLRLINNSYDLPSKIHHNTGGRYSAPGDDEGDQLAAEITKIPKPASAEKKCLSIQEADAKS